MGIQLHCQSDAVIDLILKRLATYCFYALASFYKAVLLYNSWVVNVLAENVS